MRYNEKLPEILLEQFYPLGPITEYQLLTEKSLKSTLKQILITK